MERLEAITAERYIARCAMTDLEYGFSASNRGEWVERQSLLSDGYASVNVESDDFQVALKLQSDLADAGLKGRKPADLLVAAVALRLGLTVLHYDHDFKHIAFVSALQHEWIVPHGTIS
jgi:predicted nucleic acid-binding protein